MKIKIKKHSKYKDKVVAKDIHGLFPYKAYLQLKGNSNIGQFIVVVSDKDLHKNDEKINEIEILISTKQRDTTIVRPSAFNGETAYFEVIETNILKVKDSRIYVFETLK